MDDIDPDAVAVGIVGSWVILLNQGKCPRQSRWEV